MTNELTLLTSPNAVEAAIAEWDSLGREEFLKKYGLKHSRQYPLYFNGKTYNSTAIACVAYGKQHGVTLPPSDLYGGAATVVTTLSLLGFDVKESLNPIDILVKGATYFRKDLLDQFGGQLQRGIWTPREFPVVFIFTGESGKTYGYSDGWTEDGIFQYTGEGQSGDMTFTPGNEAIRDHKKNGEDLFLFEDLGKGKGVRYLGLFECASWDEIRSTDKAKQTRKVLVFNLIPVETAANSSEPLFVSPPVSKAQSLEELRREAYSASTEGKAISKTRDTMRLWFERSKKVRDYVLARSGGICEACELPAPFKKRDGSPYLEPHHTTRLADEGPDHPAWVGAICPTCHRRIHSGEDGALLNKQLQERLIAKEKYFSISPN